MSELANKTCIPCKGNVPALKGRDLTRLLGELESGWSCINEHHPDEKTYLPGVGESHPDSVDSQDRRIDRKRFYFRGQSRSTTQSAC